MADDDPTGFESALEERQATYPEDGFALVEIDDLQPPGEALTKLEEALCLADISLPPTGELTDYVIYDADGEAYGHTSLSTIDDRVASGDLQSFVEDLEADDVRTRRLALYGLQRAAEDRPEDCLDAVPRLSTTLEASPLDLRAGALAVLATLSEEHPGQVTPVADDVLPLLDPAVDARLHPDAVRLVAAVAEHDPQAVLDAAPRLAALLAEGTQAEATTLTALNRIAEAYPDAVVPLAPRLIEYLEDDTRSHRVGAIAVLGKVAKAYPNVAAETTPAAIDLLNADSDRLRANAAGLLAELAEEYPDQVRPAVPRVIELLEDDDEKARYNATSILARVAREYPEDVEGATDALIDTLDEDFPHSRANACWALGYVGAERALYALEERRQDPHEEVQQAAEVAIRNIQSDSV